MKAYPASWQHALCWAMLQRQDTHKSMVLSNQLCALHFSPTPDAALPASPWISAWSRSHGFQFSFRCKCKCGKSTRPQRFWNDRADMCWLTACPNMVRFRACLKSRFLHMSSQVPDFSKSCLHSPQMPCLVRDGAAAARSRSTEAASQSPRAQLLQTLQACSSDREKTGPER